MSSLMITYRPAYHCYYYGYYYVLLLCAPYSPYRALEDALGVAERRSRFKPFFPLNTPTSVARRVGGNKGPVVQQMIRGMYEKEQDVWVKSVVPLS